VAAGDAAVVAVVGVPDPVSDDDAGFVPAVELEVSAEFAPAGAAGAAALEAVWLAVVGAVPQLGGSTLRRWCDRGAGMVWGVAGLAGGAED